MTLIYTHSLLLKFTPHFSDTCLVKRLILLSIFMFSCSVVPERASRHPSSLDLAKRCFHSLARSFKSSPENNSKDIEKISETWGVEMEFFKSDDYDQEKVANSLYQFFYEKFDGAVRFEKKGSFNRDQLDYLIHVEKDGESKTWTVPYEATLYSDDTQRVYGVEVTTEIFSGAEDPELFLEVIAHLKQIGLTPAREMGGTHIHLGTNNLTVGDLERIFLGLNRSYKTFREYFSPDTGRRHIEASDLLVGYNRLKSKRDKGQPLSQLTIANLFFTGGPVRFNLNYQTLEFRFFNSTTNFEEILFFKKFSKLFVEKVLSDDNFLENLESMSYQQIFKEIGLIE